MAEPDYPNGHPQVAQVAIQQGELLAENLQRIEALKKPRPFHYKNLGTLATVGRNKAVADLNKVKLHGFTAWLVWMLVHLRSILGIKNKLIVLIDWIGIISRTTVPCVSSCSSKSTNKMEHRARNLLYKR